MPTLPTIAITLSSLLLALPFDAARGRADRTPDIVPEGSKGILVETRVELGPFASRAIGSHIVKEGETLSAIAKARLGSATRWKEIAALNPTLDPNKLAIDVRLAIPPREAPEEGLELLWVFAESAPGMAWDAVPLEPDGSLRSNPRYARFQLHVVPISVRAEFDRAWTLGKGTKEALDALAQAGRIHVFEARTPGRYVATSDPTTRRVDVFRIEEPKNADGEALPPALVLASSSHFDAEGKPVTAATPRKRESTLILVLLLTGIAGAGLLVLRARRRELRAAEMDVVAA